MSFIGMGNKRITPAALSQLYKSIQAGGSITDAARLANISRQACAWLLERKYPSMFGRKDAQLANELRQLRNELDTIRGLMQSSGIHQDK